MMLIIARKKQPTILPQRDILKLSLHRETRQDGEFMEILDNWDLVVSPMPLIDQYTYQDTVEGDYYYKIYRLWAPV